MACEQMNAMRLKDFALTEYQVQETRGLPFEIMTSPEISNECWEEVEATIHSQWCFIKSNFRWVSRIEKCLNCAPMKVWLEAKPHRRAPFHASHHPSRHWLACNDFLPEKVLGIEIANPLSFVERWRNDTQFPMLFHEMAHAILHRLPLTALDQATEQAKIARDKAEYQDAFWRDGPRCPAWFIQQGAEDAYHLGHEYFACLSVALLNRNDHTPLTETELIDIDPDGHAVVTKIWTEI